MVSFVAPVAGHLALTGTPEDRLKINIKIGIEPKNNGLISSDFHRPFYWPNPYILIKIKSPTIFAILLLWSRLN